MAHRDEPSSRTPSDGDTAAAVRAYGETVDLLLAEREAAGRALAGDRPSGSAGDRPAGPVEDPAAAPAAELARRRTALELRRADLADERRVRRDRILLVEQRYAAGSVAVTALLAEHVEAVLSRADALGRLAGRMRLPAPAELIATATTGHEDVPAALRAAGEALARVDRAGRRLATAGREPPLAGVPAPVRTMALWVVAALAVLALSTVAGLTADAGLLPTGAYLAVVLALPLVTWVIALLVRRRVLAPALGVDLAPPHVRTGLVLCVAAAAVHLAGRLPTPPG